MTSLREKLIYLLIVREVGGWLSMALKLVKACCKLLNWSLASNWIRLLAATWLEHGGRIYHLITTLSQIVRRLCRGRCFKAINQILTRDKVVGIIGGDSQIELTFYLPIRFKVQSHSLVWPGLAILVGKPLIGRIKVWLLLSTRKKLSWLRLDIGLHLWLEVKIRGVLGFKLGSSSFFALAHCLDFTCKQ